MALKLFVISVVLVFSVLGQDSPVGVFVEQNNSVETSDEFMNDTDLLLAFVVFRHGDRTPDQEELDLYPNADIYSTIDRTFYPYGMKALTNKGKQRGFLVGKYLRERYDCFLSRLYIPEEISIRTTAYSRTKMTGLTALAALYPPPPPQRWNTALNWQPVPYDTLPLKEDDLMYWFNCPRYDWLKNKVSQQIEVKNKIDQYCELFEYLTEKVGRNITTTGDVFFLDNLFQALNNAGVATPKWALRTMPMIKEVTKLEYNIQFYNDELIRLSTGVVMADIVNATARAVVYGDLNQPKVRIYSAHENNVAALMSAARVFKPHQPNYGATFSIELRKDRTTGQYGFAAIYSEKAGGPGYPLPIQGCGGRTFCDYETFLSLTHDVIGSREDFKKQCSYYYNT